MNGYYTKNKTDINSDICYYIADAAIDEASQRTLLEKLNADEKIRYNKYLKKEDREMFLCSRTILREEFVSRWHIDYNAKLSFNEYQKPFLEDYPAFHFNISHTAGQVAVGFSRYPIGIDIEQMVTFDKKELLQMAETVFHESEIDFLKKQDEHEIHFYFTKLWALKESVVKALGTGFSCDTKAFSLNAVCTAAQTVLSINGNEVCFCVSIYKEKYVVVASYIININSY
jgi:4'-phosphopantetheinyl transferase